MPRKPERRRVCFVTGTRAEFGLMQSTLRALRDQPRTDLQLVVTGLHTQRANRSMLDEIRTAGFAIDAMVPWPADESPAGIARATGVATAKLAERFEALNSEIVLVVGDRVEAFAAATAAHLSGRVLAHVHGGDRAMGQVDDAIRHAISKLAHIHFPATTQSGERLFAMGEDRSRIHVVGAPGIDGIRTDALRPAAVKSALAEIGYEFPASESVLLVLHPTDAADDVEHRRAEMLLDALPSAYKGHVVALMPNGDPGSAGITQSLRARAARGEITLVTHLDRRLFLGLLRECRALIGNSSSGIIEAGSFGTPVLDIGPRQQGRERGPNVRHIEWQAAAVRKAIARVLKQPRTRIADNPYERGGAGRRIARILAGIEVDSRLLRKVIRY